MAEDADVSGCADNWEPDSPALRGEDRKGVSEGWAPTHDPHLDELTHTERLARGLVTDDPDPGYDPYDYDDQAPALVSDPV